MNNKEASIQLKLSKANSLLSEVDVLIQFQFYTTAINRLYYSCYHATRALLLTKDITPKTHSGVINMLHQHFVQNASFDGEQAAFFSRLMRQRMEDDYNDFLVLDGNAVSKMIQPAKKYVSYVEKWIKENAMR